MEAKLEITIDQGRTRYESSGDVTLLARAVAEMMMYNEEFAFSLSLAVEGAKYRIAERERANQVARRLIHWANSAPSTPNNI